MNDEHTRTGDSSVSIVTISYTPILKAIPQGIFTAVAVHVFQGVHNVWRCLTRDSLSTGIPKLTTNHKCIMDIPVVKTDGLPYATVVYLHLSTVSVVTSEKPDCFGSAAAILLVAIKNVCKGKRVT